VSISQNLDVKPDLSQFHVKVAGDKVERKLVSLTATNAVIGGLSKNIKIGDIIKFAFYVTLLEKNVPVYIKGNAIKRDGDEVTIEYDAPVKSWPKILQALDVTS